MYIPKLNLFDVDFNLKDRLLKTDSSDGVSVFDFFDNKDSLESLLQNNNIKEIVEEILKNIDDESPEIQEEIKNLLNFINSGLELQIDNSEKNLESDVNSEDADVLEKLFTEDISKDDFKKEFDNLNTEVDETPSAIMNKIEELGAENVFNAVDTDTDGILSNSEIADLKEENSVSEEKLNNIFEQISSEQQETSDNEIPESNNPEAPAVPAPTSSTSETTTDDTDSELKTDSTEETKETKKTKHSKKSSKGSKGGNNPKPADNDVPEAEEKETVADLMNQKKEIISTADSKIDAANKELDELVENSDADKELKEDYENAKTAYEENEKEIKDNEAQILEYENSLHDIDKSITSLNAELTAITANSQNTEANEKVSARIGEIQQELSDLEAQKERIETKKKELEENNSNLKADETSLKTAMEEAFAALELSPANKLQADYIKEKIEKLEASKQTEVSKIDEQIQVLKAQEIEESRAAGEKKGQLEANTVGEQIANAALQYVGYKGNSDGSSMFHNGSGGWCAAFVEYVVKEVGQNNNIDYAKLDSHTSPSPMALYTMNKEHSYSTNDYSTSELKNIVKPGMGFVCKGGGKSGYHAGIVESVNDDGTFNTIEGNYGNRVAQSQRGLSKVYYFVDFSYLFN